MLTRWDGGMGIWQFCQVLVLVLGGRVVVKCYHSARVQFIASLSPLTGGQSDEIIRFETQGASFLLLLEAGKP